MNAPKRSALVKQHPAPGADPAQDDGLVDFIPSNLGATKVSSGSTGGKVFRGRDMRQPQNGAAQQTAELDDEAAFLAQPAPAKAAAVGRILGNRRTETAERKLPPIAASSVSIPTSDPPPPGAPLPPPPITVDKKIIAEAEEKAKQIIAAGQEQVQKLMAQANEQIQQFNEQAAAEAEQLRQMAFKKGTDEGLAEGKRQAHSEYVDLMISARDLYVQGIKERRKLIETTEPELARLSIQIAEKIIGLEVTTNSDVIMGVVKEALSDMKDREQVRIHVNPDDYHIVNNDRTSLMRMVEGLKDFDLTIDSKVTRGGCIIETNLGNIDARLETQLGTIQTAFERSSAGKEADDGADAG